MKERKWNQVYSKWEMNVLSKLRKSEIEIEKKFRRFPLKIDENVINYEPDFVLDFPYKGRKHVIIEVHENLTDYDVKKFRAFMDVYGRVYWFIVVAKYEQLRRWNGFDDAEQSLFHDIWTLEDIDIMISQLEKLRKTEIKNYQNEVAICPKCGKRATGRFEIEALFGYRYGRKVVQSYCRECRS